jgi:hypothetical protein
MLLVTRGLACFGMQPALPLQQQVLFFCFFFFFTFLDHDMPFELMRKIPTIKQSLFIT